MKIAFNDWNQLAGTIKFSVKTKSVFCLAYKFIKPPACSNAPQKTITIKNAIYVTRILSFSILDPSL